MEGGPLSSTFQAGPGHRFPGLARWLVSEGIQQCIFLGGLEGMGEGMDVRGRAVECRCDLLLIFYRGKFSV